MATAKQNQESSAALGLVIGFIICAPLLIISIYHYYRLRSIYKENEHSQRVFDVGNLVRPFVLALLPVLIAWRLYALILSSGSAVSTVVTAAILITTLFILFKISKLISSTYYGVFIDPENDRIVLPKDMGNYSVSDYIKLKFITELGTMEEVPLSQIKRITRQGGKKLFIHGKFGARGMTFSSKQKRDECLSAVEVSSSLRATLELEAG